MPTTDGAAASTVLAALRASNVDFAMLHGAERLDRPGLLSDVDIVVRAPPASAIAQARGELLRNGLVPVIVWPYDIGGSTTVFLTDDRATSGVQLDMLHDPEGMGRYRIRSDALATGGHSGNGIPSVTDTDRLIYLWVKRRSKDQGERRRTVEESLRSLDPDAVSEAARRIITRDDWIGDITGERGRSMGTRWTGEAKRVLLRGRRVASRLAAPIGFWAHLGGGHNEVAGQVAERFGRVLVRATFPRSPGGRLAWPWYALEVVPVRLRPGLVVSYGDRPRGVPAPDLVLGSGVVDVDDVDEVAALLVRSMSERLAQ